MKHVIWNGNVEHIEEHGLTVEEVEHVIANHDETGFSRSSGLPCFFGYTPSGEYIIVVYEDFGEGAIYPITAYEI